MITFKSRTDSDIFIAYGPSADEYAKRKKIEKELAKSLPQIISGKRKLVAWMVSNCGDESGRKSYVKELQKYIDVDIYGDCGPLNCNNKSNPFACCKLLIRYNYLIKS